MDHPAGDTPLMTEKEYHSEPQFEVEIKTPRKEGYHERLSRASQLTLIAQGGPMDAAEARDFEARSDFEALIRMRTWDDLAKDPSIEADPTLTEKYRRMCQKILI